MRDPKGKMEIQTRLLALPTKHPGARKSDFNVSGFRFGFGGLGVSVGFSGFQSKGLLYRFT